jgi:hypothetical protein
VHKNLLMTATGVAILLAASAGVWTYYSDIGEHIPLTPESAVRDFRAAAKSVRSHWLDKMCANGACLDPVDWKCGYSFTSINPEEDLHTETGREVMYREIRIVRDCFEKLAATSPLTDRLNKLRLLCGRHFMLFKGERSGYKPDDCVKAGGEWGKKRTVFVDEDKYFAN